MSGLGKILSLAFGTEATNPILKGISSNIKTSVSIQIPYEEATSAVLNSLYKKITDNLQNKYNLIFYPSTSQD